jgi:predicted metal-dependent peptidase
LGVFTDGEGQAPEQSPHYPVLWVLPSKYSKPSSWGSEQKLKIKKINFDNVATYCWFAQTC